MGQPSQRCTQHGSAQQRTELTGKAERQQSGSSSSHLPSRLAALLHWGIKVHCDSRGKGGRGEAYPPGLPLLPCCPPPQ
jgi:hypothetical protein